MRNTRTTKGGARVPRRSGVAGLYVVPRLEELAVDPGIAGVLDAHTLDGLTTTAIMALGGLISRKLSLIAEMAAAKPEVELDRLITAKEVAKRLGVSCVWVYHRKDLPFEVRLGTVRRFSESGLTEFIRKLKGT
jgi:predicted DNA-binding transcriptional regulator AlpA